MGLKYRIMSQIRHFRHFTVYDKLFNKECHTEQTGALYTCCHGCRNASSKPAPHPSLARSMPIAFPGWPWPLSPPWHEQQFDRFNLFDPSNKNSGTAAFTAASLFP